MTKPDEQQTHGGAHQFAKKTTAVRLLCFRLRFSDAVRRVMERGFVNGTRGWVEVGDLPFSDHIFLRHASVLGMRNKSV